MAWINLEIKQMKFTYRVNRVWGEKSQTYLILHLLQQIDTYELTQLFRIIDFHRNPLIFHPIISGFQRRYLILCLSN